MPKTKPSDDGKSQRQKFIETAREHGVDGDEDAFKKALRQVARAPATKPKKVAHKAK